MAMFVTELIAAAMRVVNCPLAQFTRIRAHIDCQLIVRIPQQHKSDLLAVVSNQLLQPSLALHTSWLIKLNPLRELGLIGSELEENGSSVAAICTYRHSIAN
jgi:hypothetical protein